MRSSRRPPGASVAGMRARQPGGKVVHVWAIERDWDASKLRSNSFQMEWPPKSGRMQDFPEVDRGAWFAPQEAARKILKGQAPVLEALYSRLRAGADRPSRR